MRTRLLAGIAALGLFACGLDDADRYARDCGDGPTAAERARMVELTAANRAARLAAVDAARAATGFQPLTAVAALSADAPAADFPYPDAVRVGDPAGAPIDLAAGIWSHASHAGDALNVYETAPGSGRYFIVDRVGGDGAGASTADALGSVEHYHLHGGSLAERAPSFHNWHANAANELVRLELAVDTAIERTIRLCGCGEGGEAVDAKRAADASEAPPVYGIFELPVGAAPKAATTALTAAYTQTRIVLEYVPEKGKQCRKREVVC